MQIFAQGGRSCVQTQQRHYVQHQRQEARTIEYDNNNNSNGGSCSAIFHNFSLCSTFLCTVVLHENLLIFNWVAVQYCRRFIRRTPPRPIVSVAACFIILLDSCTPRWPLQLFLYEIPHHKWGVCAAHCYNSLIAIEKTCTCQHTGIDFRFVKFGAWTNTRISVGN